MNLLISTKSFKTEVVFVFLFLSYAQCIGNSQQTERRPSSMEESNKLNDKEEQIAENTCNKDDTNCSAINSDKECINLNDKTLGPKDPSWFVIVAQGRLGNHLVAYSVIKTLAKTLHIRPLIPNETKQYLKKFFDFKDSILVLEEAFCNTEEVLQSKMKYFDGSIDGLVQDKRYHK